MRLDHLLATARVANAGGKTKAARTLFESTIQRPQARGQHLSQFLACLLRVDIVLPAASPIDVHQPYVG